VEVKYYYIQSIKLQDITQSWNVVWVPEIRKLFLCLWINLYCYAVESILLHFFTYVIRDLVVTNKIALLIVHFTLLKKVINLMMAYN